MRLHCRLLSLALLASLTGLCQTESPANNRDCTQYLDTMSGRQIYQYPEKDAEYKGGTEKFSNYLNQSFNYDKSHVDHPANLTFTFIVEVDGSVSNVMLRYPAHGVMDDVVQLGLSAFRKMPKLKPAICNNQKVPVRLTQSVMVSPNPN